MLCAYCHYRVVEYVQSRTFITWILSFFVFCCLDNRQPHDGVSLVTDCMCLVRVRLVCFVGKGLLCIFTCFCVSLDHFGFVLSLLLGLVFSVPSQQIGFEERLRNDIFFCQIGHRTMLHPSILWNLVTILGFWFLVWQLAVPATERYCILLTSCSMFAKHVWHLVVT